MLNANNREINEIPPEACDEAPTVSTLPDEHPCSGCTILETITGVPYCFLPRCDRDIFKIGEST